MPLIISLAITASLVALVSTGFCALFNHIEGYWPRWHFWLFLAWWWPFRSESAATLAAIAMDADSDAWKATSAGSYSGRSISSEALNAKVFEGWLDHSMSLKVGDEGVPLTLWDGYVLARSFTRWQDRRRETERKAATLEAAATFAQAFRSKYGRAQ